MGWKAEWDGVINWSEDELEAIACRAGESRLSFYSFWGFVLEGPNVRGEAWLQTWSGGEGLGRSNFCKIRGLKPGRHILYLHKMKESGEYERLCAFCSVEAGGDGVASEMTLMFGHGTDQPEELEYSPGLRCVVGDGEASGEAIRFR